MWHLMGSAGCGAARLKSQSANGPHATESAPSSTPSLGHRSARELGSTSCPASAARLRRFELGAVEIAVGQTDRTLQNRRRHLLPPSGIAPLGSSVRPPVRRVLLGYAGLNSVPCRSMACMMMARRRASAIRALRIVDRLAIANAQSLSFSGSL